MNTTQRTVKGEAKYDVFIYIQNLTSHVNPLPNVFETAPNFH